MSKRLILEIVIFLFIYISLTAYYLRIKNFHNGEKETNETEICNILSEFDCKIVPAFGGGKTTKRIAIVINNSQLLLFSNDMKKILINKLSAIKNKNITGILLRNCSLNDDDIIMVMSSICDMSKNIDILDVSKNNISNASICVISERLPNLRVIDVRKTNITILSYIEFNKMKKLLYLDADDIIKCNAYFLSNLTDKNVATWEYDPHFSYKGRHIDSNGTVSDIFNSDAMVRGASPSVYLPISDFLDFYPEHIDFFPAEKPILNR